MAKYTRYDKKVLPDHLLIKKLRSAAKIYRQYVDKDVLIVYAQSRKGPFYTYEFHAGAKNFQHLAGVKSPKGAIWFFDKCLDDENLLKREDIVPKRDIKTTSAKISVLPDAVDLTKSKAYKFGEKDLTTLDNEFEVALGNVSNIMGLDKRDYPLPIPVTVMDRSMYDFCSKGLTIFLIMTKMIKEDKYRDVFYEITPNILEKADFNDEVWNVIGKEQEEISETIAEAAVTAEMTEGNENIRSN